MRIAVLVLALIATALMAPALILGAPGIDSAAFNYVWTSQFADALGRGELYPRWLPRSFEGLGSPTFYFYPPLAFYLSGLFDLAGAPTRHAISLAGLTLMFASGLTMYAWLHGKTRHALLGACLYMAAPYHLTDFYVRAALAEFAAFVWLPLIALAIEAQPRRWAIPLLAVAYAGLILSHLPMVVLTTFGLIGPWVIFRTLKEKSLAVPASSLLAGVLGLGLAGLYLVPALGLQDHLSTAILWGPLYKPSDWSILSPNPDTPTGILYALACLALGWAMLAVGAGRGFWSVLALATATLSLGLPPFIWSLPIIEQVQFPWRILAIVEFAALTAFIVAPKRPWIIALAAAIALVGVFKLAEAGVKAFATPYPADLAQVMPDAPEYLPKAFHAPGVVSYEFRPDLRAFDGPLVRGPVAGVVSDADGTLEFQVTAPGRVTIRRAVFPAWRVTREGREVGLVPGTLIAFDAEPGRYRIERVLLPQERIGGWLSAFAALALAGLTAWAARGGRARAGYR
jgi:uncharacterized membrane protein